MVAKAKAKAVEADEGRALSYNDEAPKKTGYVSKAEMIRTIQSANKRMQRLRSAGFTKGDAYYLAQKGIAQVRGENPFHPKHVSLSISGTRAEMKTSYKEAKKIMENKQLSVRHIKNTVEYKRAETFSREYGVDVTKSLYSLLSSDALSNAIAQHIISSDEAVRIYKEMRSNRDSTADLDVRLQAYLLHPVNNTFTNEDAMDAIRGTRKFTSEQLQEAKGAIKSQHETEAMLRRLKKAKR